MIISIDGSCKRNGKPDCISLGAMFVVNYNNEDTYFQTIMEQNSTNQRGEINALILALEQIRYRSTASWHGDHEEDICIVTDSEYIYNTVNKGWLTNWQHKGWVNKDNEPIKNKDLWQYIAGLLTDCPEFVLYCIKGHMKTVSKGLAKSLIENDETGGILYRFVKNMKLKPENLDIALKNFTALQGHTLPYDVLERLVDCNTVADTLAVYEIGYEDLKLNINNLKGE